MEKTKGLIVDKFDTREVQVLLGHTEFNTTQIYLKDDSKEIMETILT